MDLEVLVLQLTYTISRILSPVDLSVALPRESFKALVLLFGLFHCLWL